MKTQKIILTGGPSTGKSTIIKELEKRGYPVIHEVARKIIQSRANYAPTKQEWKTRQSLIYQEQLKEESKYQNEKIVFLDRGSPDIIAYSKYHLGETSSKFKTSHYDKIFLLERLPFENDGLRIESGETEAQEVHDIIHSTYKELGYNPTPVPVFPSKNIQASIETRTNFILSKLENLANN